MRKYWMPPKKRLLPKRIRFVTYETIRDIPQKYLLQCHKLTLGPSGMMQDFTYDELQRREVSFRWDGLIERIGPITLCIYRNPVKIKGRQPDTVLAWMLLDGDYHVQMFTHKKYRKKGLAFQTATRWLRKLPNRIRGDIGTYNDKAFKTLVSAKIHALPPKLRKDTYIQRAWGW